MPEDITAERVAALGLISDGLRATAPVGSSHQCAADRQKSVASLFFGLIRTKTPASRLVALRFLQREVFFSGLLDSHCARPAVSSLPGWRG